jgi:carbon storage regulator
MVIITRKAGERIRIGPDVKVQVIGISRDLVRLGIQAPKGVAVDREEIYVRKKARAPVGGEPRAPR